MSERRQRFVPCGTCGGSGTEMSPEWARARRLRAKVGLRVLARRMGITSSYLSDMELGRRRFTGAQERSFLAALENTP